MVCIVSGRLVSRNRGDWQVVVAVSRINVSGGAAQIVMAGSHGSGVKERQCRVRHN